MTLDGKLSAPRLLGQPISDCRPTRPNHTTPYPLMDPVILSASPIFIFLCLFSYVLSMVRRALVCPAPAAPPCLRPARPSARSSAEPSPAPPPPHHYVRVLRPLAPATGGPSHPPCYWSVEPSSAPLKPRGRARGFCCRGKPPAPHAPLCGCTSGGGAGDTSPAETPLSC